MLRLRRQFYDMVTSLRFERFIACVITINVLVMAITYRDMPTDYGTVLARLNDIGSWIFVVEFLSKIMAFGIRQYFNVGWYRYEFINMVAGMVDFFSLGQSVHCLTFASDLVNQLKYLSSFE
jgi:hypothetical protein